MTFQDNSLFPPNLACFAPWRESIPLIENFRIVMANNKCLHLRVTTLMPLNEGRPDVRNRGCAVFRA